MKFRITREHVYPWPVTVSVPDPDSAGAVLEQSFTMTFRAMPLDEAEALDAEIAALPVADQAKRQHDHIRQICQGWDEAVVGDDGKPLPFTVEALDLALIHSWFRIGVMSAYRDSLQGRAAQLGN